MHMRNRQGRKREKLREYVAVNDADGTVTSQVLLQTD